MAKTAPQQQQATGQRAAIYARVSDKSQDTEDKTSISEQVGEMEAYCEGKGLTITARYQEVGRGWSKKRPEFQRMLADAKSGRFDTIVCWKSDRLSRGMYPAAALMEVVEAHQITARSRHGRHRHEDLRPHGGDRQDRAGQLPGAFGSMGKRGTAKQGRIPSGGLPYGYRIGDDGKPEIVEAEAEIVRRIFRQYVHEDMGSPAIAWQLTDDGVPTAQGGAAWRQAQVHSLLGNDSYLGIWAYGKTRQVSTEDGKRVFDQPKEAWIEVPIPPLVDQNTWDRTRILKKQRLMRSTRNTKAFYLLQHLLRCSECGLHFCGRSVWNNSNPRSDKLDPANPRRYYKCTGMHSMRLRCRERPYIRAERIEEIVWSEVSRVLQNPDLIVAGMESLHAQDSGGLDEEIGKAERQLRSVQMEEDRAIRLYVSGKITEDQLDHQRKFITGQLEILRNQLDDLRARAANGAEKQATMEAVLAWAGEVGDGLDEMTPEQRKAVLQLVLENAIIDKHNQVRINLAIPAEVPVSIASASSAWT